ncbi:MAG: SpoIIE family protein phosphatase [Fibrobacteria bacterium]|nr:SpoIIE family protein phosphatase [Fibrobacteria bacterium]
MGARELSRDALSDPGGEPEVGVLLLELDGRIRSMNQWAAWLFDVDPADWRGRKAKDLGGHLLGDGPLADVGDHLASPRGFSEWEVEHVLHGETRVFRLRTVSQGLDVALLIDDLTERRVVDSRFKAVLGSSRDGLVVVDEFGMIVWPNSRFGHLFGLHWRQFKGMKFQTAVDLISECFVSPAELRAFLKLCESTPEGHHETILDVSWPEPCVLQVSTRPISNERGRNIGRVWTFADITSFKRMERQLRVNNMELEFRVRERTQELESKNRDLEKAHTSLENVNEALELELDMAKQVQDGLLPERLPDLPGWSLHSEYMPTGKVGGDFFDVVDMHDGTVFLVMADVSGHGVPAALVTAMAKMSFLRWVKPGYPLDVSEVLAAVNSDLRRAVRTDHYLTAFAAHLDLATGLLRYCRVCHPYPFVVRADGRTERLDHRGGFFIGMIDEARYTQAEILLEKGDMLFMYTDGLNESADPQGRLFGLQRLEAALVCSHLDGPAATVHNALAQRDGHSMGRPPNDDITILALTRD